MNGNSPNFHNGLDDDILMGDFASGNERAYEVIYERYKNKIFNFIYRMVGDREIAKDVAQDVFIKVYLKARDYKKKGLFKAWIYTIASNLAKNTLKKRKKDDDMSIFQAILKDDSKLELKDILVDKALSARRILQNMELAGLIAKAMDSLPAIFKEVLLLCVFDGLSYEEAAIVLKTNVKTVSSRLARARAGFIKIINSMKEG